MLPLPLLRLQAEEGLHLHKPHSLQGIIVNSMVDVAW